MAATVSGAAGHSVSNLADIHNTLAAGGGGGSTDNGSGLAFGLGGHAMVSSSAPQSPAAVHGPVAFAGQSSAPAGSVVATQDVQPGGVTLHLNDGSTINVLGASHVDSTLFHK
jgi:hypothetical protein